MLEIIYLALLVYQYCAERVFVTLVVDLILSAFIGKGEPLYLTMLFHYDVQGKCKKFVFIDYYWKASILLLFLLFNLLH